MKQFLAPLALVFLLTACSGTSASLVGGNSSSSVSSGSIIDTSSGAVTSPQTATTKNGCVISGCSAELCVDSADAGMSPCIWKDEYACYKTATCEVQANGKCGWTQTPQLQSCIQNARG